MVKLVRCLNLPRYFMNPGFGYVTIRIRRADARTIRIVDGALVFAVDVILHFVAGNTNLLIIAQVH